MKLSSVQIDRWKRKWRNTWTITQEKTEGESTKIHLGSILTEKGLKGKVPKHILEAFCQVIRTECKGQMNYVKRSYNAEVKEAIWQKQMIGIELMLRCFLVKGWMTAMEESGAPHPDRCMDTLQHLIWDTVTDPLWHERNEIINRRKKSIMR